MCDEYNAMVHLVPHPADANVIRGMWIFRNKKKSYCSFERYKALFVANGKGQEVGVDCDETFSLVVKPTTIRTILSLVVSRKWSIHQLDVKNAFLHGNLQETVYMHQPPGFVDPDKPKHDLGPLSYFLGIFVSRSKEGMFLCQRKYAQEILARANMSYCKPASTPVDTKSKLSASSGNKFDNANLYRQLDGALQYLTFTRPDITYAVQQMCLFMHDPRESHFYALKRILRYIKDTLNYGMHL
ncbi:uncharacterized protein LOC110711915 [Chenopodium quinoa]|uniref:uncharacterized protein LOC110711915 n=1 Tax=Chenopodium quinoa TaxID=63459 RepID=UPI000B7983C3|nr:uncharacterized protein LOC110711915 [Chenopodium quinoa]